MRMANNAFGPRNSSYLSPKLKLLIMFKNPFSFEGCIRRTEFGMSMIFYLLSIPVIITIVKSFGGGEGIFFLLFIPVIWFVWAHGAKRCHDRGNSGWYQLVPLYGFWMLFADSDYGPNEYGPNPKGFGNDDDEIDRHLITPKHL